MIVAAIDVESTGLREPEHRLIEIYAVKHEFPSGIFHSELKLRLDPQRAIAADAQRVHGISSMELIGKPTFDEAADAIRAFLDEADLFVWHNGDDFDGPFINQELERVGRPKLAKPAYDTMRNCKWATPSGKPPSLAELCLACDVAYDPSLAHAAEYDVQVMWTAFTRAYSWGWIELPA